MRIASNEYYFALGRAIVDAMQKGWSYRLAATFLLEDSVSLANKTRQYSTAKLKAAAVFESRWFGRGHWRKAKNSDQHMSIDSYIVAIVEQMAKTQPESFHVD